MERFYVHVRGPDASLAEDLDGIDLPDREAARRHALAMALDLVNRTRLDGLRDWFDCTFEIADAQGKVVMRVPFGDALPSDEDEPPDGL